MCPHPPMLGTPLNRALNPEQGTPLDLEGMRIGVGDIKLKPTLLGWR